MNISSISIILTHSKAEWEALGERDQRILISNSWNCNFSNHRHLPLLGFSNKLTICGLINVKVKVKREISRQAQKNISNKFCQFEIRKKDKNK